MKKLLILFFLSFPAYAGTLQYNDVKTLLNQVTAHIVTDQITKKQFIYYGVWVKMSSTSSPFLICNVYEITDPPGVWEDTGADVKVGQIFSLYLSFPNAKPAINIDPAWCSRIIQ